MPTATVTPGYVFAPNELVTYAKLNALGTPGVSVTGTTSGSSSIQNYLRNGNFYGSTWLTPAGVTAPTNTETGNAQFWTVNPAGAAVTYSQSTVVPNTHSLFTLAVTGATSVTTVNVSQTILGDLSDTLNGNVSFSAWIFNSSGTNLTPTLIISSANSYNNFSAVTQIASANLATITNGLWAFETASINLTGLSNVNNGLKISIQFPSGSLLSGAFVLVSQATLVPGTSPITYIDDFGLFSTLGYQPLYNPINNVVLNGNFDINQPVGTYSGLTGAGAVQTFDSWIVQTTGTLSVTLAQNNGASVAPLNVYNPFIKNSGKITVQTAEASLSSGDFLLVQNRIEGYRMGPLQGRPLSLQFWVRSTTIGTYWINLQNNNNTCAYLTSYSITAVNTWQQITIQNIPAMLTTTGAWNFITGTGLQITWALALGSGVQTSSGNAGFWLGLGAFYGTSSQTNLVASTSNTWEVTGVQLEAGAVCTPLNYIALPDQLLQLQRYYQKTYDLATAPGTIASNGQKRFVCQSATTTAGSDTFVTRLRVAPSTSQVFIYSPVTGAGGAMSGSPDVRDALGAVDRVPSTITIGEMGMDSMAGFGALTASTAGYANSILFHRVVDVRL